MFISKALQNIRQRPSGNYSSLAADYFWSPVFIADQAMPLQAPVGLERACGVAFSSGSALTDTDWMAIQASVMSLAAIRTWTIANRSDVTWSTTFASTGPARLLFQEGQRTVDFVDNTLGYFTYASAFTRMYIMITNATSISTSTGISSMIELTPADLKAMGADITIDANGVGTLNSPLTLNSIVIK
ncbi:hypothetical protein YOLOSWAG_74 [Erwinia phage vB_EamM_Yoloswag]|uniref:Uncharacterized protein n=1 Tax=Erwinia phage vB_EamM_Yoloswag TaxID=1958956 RepID=A0A1S6L2Z8_9CAUD|nr:hypothetical protein HOR66_gp074 [Erwinia phage vB_EamM_Yoloswag]AQT28557.1 hypothetical protein YOLOSWAG_74 [Erwinia phage vB_EamM_Yoloswag]